MQHALCGDIFRLASCAAPGFTISFISLLMYGRHGTIPLFVLHQVWYGFTTSFISLLVYITWYIPPYSVLRTRCVFGCEICRVQSRYTITSDFN